MKKAMQFEKSRKKKVLYSGFRFAHHNEFAGYDLIPPPQAAYICGNKLPFGSFDPKSNLRKLNYVFMDFLTMVYGFFFDTVHYILPEYTGLFSPIILRFFGKRIVYTFHLDVLFWTGKTQGPFHFLVKFNMRACDVIIALSKAHEDALKKIYPFKEIVFIPHGYFFNGLLLAESELIQRKMLRKIIVVGSNFRDIGMLYKIIKLNPVENVHFHLVGLFRHVDDSIKRLENVTVHGRLTYSEYNALLNESSVLLLPLIFATANNALLEAYSFGLPVICSNIDGVKDYAVPGAFFFDDETGFWNEYSRVVSMSDEDYIQLSRQIYLNAQARFDWHHIRQVVGSLY
jgi:glycosyltransferase involved in cell wall biosynthesis